MKMYIPQIKDEIILTKKWDFTLYAEGRNESLIKLFDSFDYKKFMDEQGYDRLFDSQYEDMEKDDDGYWKPSVLKSEPAYLPAGTILVIDRIYIRNGAEDFSSVTFRVKETPDSRIGKKKPRFWAKLADVNTIEFNIC